MDWADYGKATDRSRWSTGVVKVLIQQTVHCRNLFGRNSNYFVLMIFSQRLFTSCFEWVRWKLGHRRLKKFRTIAQQNIGRCGRNGRCELRNISSRSLALMSARMIGNSSEANFLSHANQLDGADPWERAACHDSKDAASRSKCYQSIPSDRPPDSWPDHQALRYLRTLPK